MINWLNQNQGFTMSVLTSVYVIATIVIVIYSRKTIKEMKESREEETRPYVFAYLQKDPRDACFYLRVKNFGKTGAKIEGICISPDLKLVKSKNNYKFLQNTILAPHQTLQFVVLEKWAVTCENTYSVLINYSQLTSKKRFEERYDLIVEYAHQMGYTDHNISNLSDEANALQNVANYLDCIRNKL